MIVVCVEVFLGEKCDVVFLLVWDFLEVKFLKGKFYYRWDFIVYKYYIFNVNCLFSYVNIF